MCIPDEVIISILARLPVLEPLKFSHFPRQWRRLLKCEEFYEMHLKRENEENPTCFSMLLKSNDPAIQQYKIDPFPKQKQIAVLPGVVSIICVIGSCDGIVGMRCKTGEYNYLMVWNPPTNRARYLLYHHHQENATSIGMGRKERVYHFVTIDGQFNTVYDSRTNSWGKKANSELNFWVSEPTCDVSIKGIPYWRASWPAFGSESENHDSGGGSVEDSFDGSERIDDNFGGCESVKARVINDRFIVYTNWEDNKFRRIDYPEIEFPLCDFFRSNKLIQVNDRLGFFDFSPTMGVGLCYEIWTFAEENGGKWTRACKGSSSNLHRFWFTPTGEVVYQKEENGASYSKRDINKKYGPYTPVVLNHINTLAFF
ncbi:hypothetical protein LguiA_014873 [Lonicera macranthoides]